jgi:hypothetical protein
VQPEYQTVEQMHDRLLTMIRSRRDTGFTVAVADALLEPRNPFDSAKLRPKTAIAFGAALSLLLLVVFVYFSMQSGK